MRRSNKNEMFDSFAFRRIVKALHYTRVNPISGLQARVGGLWVLLLEIRHGFAQVRGQPFPPPVILGEGKVSDLRFRVRCKEPLQAREIHHSAIVNSALVHRGKRVNRMDRPYNAHSLTLRGRRRSLTTGVPDRHRILVVLIRFLSYLVCFILTLTIRRGNGRGHSTS